VNNPNAPAGVKIDSYLYLAVAEDKLGGDFRGWLKKAYDLNPYSKITVQYLCMSHLAALARMDQTDFQGSAGSNERHALNQIIEATKTLFATDDAWIRTLRSML
jgi:hypothetical protein